MNASNNQFLARSETHAGAARLRRAACGLLIGLGLACHSVRGDDDEIARKLAKLKEMSVADLMQVEVPTVYGASKHEQKATEAPSAVSVITRDDIKVYGYRTLADI